MSEHVQRALDCMLHVQSPGLSWSIHLFPRNLRANSTANNGSSRQTNGTWRRHKFRNIRNIRKKLWKMKTESGCFFRFLFFFGFKPRTPWRPLPIFVGGSSIGRRRWRGQLDPGFSVKVRKLCGEQCRKSSRNSSASMSRNLRTTWKILLPNRPKRCLSCRSCQVKSAANPCSTSNQSQLSPPHASRQALARARSRPALPFAATGDTRHTLPRSCRWTSHKNRTQNSQNFTMFHYLQRINMNQLSSVCSRLIVLSMLCSAKSQSGSLLLKKLEQCLLQRKEAVSSLRHRK